MDFLAPALHYSSIAFIVTLTSIGVGIGGGKATMKSLEALNQAPTTYPDIFKMVIIGLALIETSAILGIVMGLLLIFSGPYPEPLWAGIAQWGIALALGLTGTVVGIYSALPAQQAAFSIARQPFFSPKIINIMLITQSIVQTPIIFSFLIALIIKSQLSMATDVTQSIRLLASGLCIGVGSIGPTIGLARFAQAAQKAIGQNRNAFNILMPFTFISQAIIETPVIFSVLVSMVLLFITIKPGNVLLTCVACIATALSAALGTFGPGLASSRMASAACLEISKNPENSSLLSRTSIVGQGVIDAAAMYALLVSLIIILLR